jgi:hypothetical protein
MTSVLDLYVTEPVLGNDSRLVREAGISFGRPIVGPLGDNELPEYDQRRPDLTNWRFTRLELPFDLEDLAGGRRYVAAKVGLIFDNDKVSSRGLSRPALLADGEAEDSELDTWGIGRHELSWKLTARDVRAGIRPKGRALLAILESPVGTGRLTGTLDAEVSFIHSMLGVARRKTANPEVPLRFALNVDDGDFALDSPPTRQGGAAAG